MQKSLGEKKVRRKEMEVVDSKLFSHPRVNFTKILAQSANAPAQNFCRNQFHQQNFAQLYQ